MAPTAPESFGRRAQRALTRLLVFCVVVALLGAVTFLLSQLNARRFSVAALNGNLVVMKGRPLPIGTLPFHPLDPRPQAAYAPIPLHGTDPGTIVQRTFDDRDELDRSLFELLRVLAEPRLSDSSSERLEEGLFYLERAALLTGLTPDQRQTLLRMQTDIAYYRGRTLLSQALSLLQQAMEQINLAAKSENVHQRAAQQMLLEVEAPAKALDEGLRRSVHQISAPKSPPPLVVPAPAEKPDAGSVVDAGVAADAGLTLP